MTTAAAMARSPSSLGTAACPTGASPRGTRAHLEPAPGHARRWRESIIGHVRRHDEGAVIRALAHAADVLSPAERICACWIPCLIGIEESRCRGRPFACAATVAHFIAVNARVALMHFPVRAHAPWLVGLSMTDQSAAHVLALLHARQGSAARPWWAPGLPRRGSYMMVSTLAVAWPAAQDRRCLGVLSLAEEAHSAAGGSREHLTPA
jgi:hypothetical protein